MSNDEISLDQMHFDALKEVGNIGIGNAATALAKLINKKVEINIPETKFVPISSFCDVVGGADQLVTGILVEVQGDLGGQSIFVMDDDSAKKFSDLIMQQPQGTTTELAEVELSALKEMANIFVGVYLTAIGNLSESRVVPGLPTIANDMAQSVLDALLMTFATRVDELLVVKAIIEIEGHPINASFLLMFDNESLKKILDQINAKYQL